jgi:hypothetical protein
VRNTLQAEEDLTSLCITETEEYLGLLREQRTTIQTQVAEANAQIGLVREVLESGGISEMSSDEDEDSASSASSPPRSSDFMCLAHYEANTMSDQDADEVMQNSPRWERDARSSPSSYLRNSFVEDKAS